MALDPRSPAFVRRWIGHVRATEPTEGECYWCGRKGWMLGAFLSYEMCDEVCARMYVLAPLEVDCP